MINKDNYFTNNDTVGQKVTANVTIMKNGVQTEKPICYSSIGSEFNGLFNNNIATLGGIVAAIHTSDAGTYFGNGSTHIRKDVHYNG